MKTSRLESETVILWNDAESDALINTRSMPTVRKMTKKGYVFKELPENSGLWRSIVPKRLCIPRAIKSKTPRKSGGAVKKTAFVEVA